MALEFSANFAEAHHATPAIDVANDSTIMIGLRCWSEIGTIKEAAGAVPAPSPAPGRSAGASLSLSALRLPASGQMGRGKRRHTRFLLHTAAAVYPDDPTEDDRLTDNVEFIREAVCKNDWKHVLFSQAQSWGSMGQKRWAKNTCCSARTEVRSCFR